MNPTEFLKPGIDAGFRAFGTDAGSKNSLPGSAREPFNATLERVVGRRSRESGLKKGKQSGDVSHREHHGAEGRDSVKERLDRKNPASEALISDCPVAPVCPRVHEVVPARPGPPAPATRCADEHTETGTPHDVRSSSASLVAEPGLDSDCGTRPSDVRPAISTGVHDDLNPAARVDDTKIEETAPAPASEAPPKPDKTSDNNGGEKKNIRLDFSAGSTASLAPPSQPGTMVASSALTSSRLIMPNAGGTSAAKSDNEMKKAAIRNEMPRLDAKQIPIETEFGGAGGSRTPAEKPEAPRPSNRDTATFVLASVDPALNSPRETESIAESPDLQHTRVGLLGELILNEVHVFRQTRADRVEVVLKPDAQTEISIRFQWHNGQVEALARCQSGEFYALNAQWPQLQQALSHQGIRLMELNSPAFSANNGAANFGQNQDQGQFRRQQPWSPLEASVPFSAGSIAPAQNSKRSVASSPKRLLESWA